MCWSLVLRGRWKALVNTGQRWQEAPALTLRVKWNSDVNKVRECVAGMGRGLERDPDLALAPCEQDLS